MNATQYHLQGSVAVITLDNPPVNGLSHALRQGIVADVARANADANARAIVLIGAGKAFSGGADIREFNTPDAEADPSIRAVISALEDSAKPVVAAIQGACMGGGLEVALGCHFRVALPDALIGLPEINLGILPGGGGTQRLPRVVGVEMALDMILSGRPAPAKKLADTQLLDALIDGDLKDGAVAFADKAVAEGLPLKRVADMPVEFPNAAAFFAEARAKTAAQSRHLPAPLKCIEAIEAAATRPIEEGLAVEWRLFEELVKTSESKALIHYFFAERAAAKIADVPADTPIRPINRVAMIGFGTMGGGISMNFANVGIPVTLVDVSDEALDRGLSIIRKNYERSVKRGRMTEADVEQRMGLITPTLSYDDLREVDLVIEAVFEDLALKERIFKQIDDVARAGAILATNTSTLDINRIAAATRRPQDVVGLHFFSPANVMRLLEVVRGEQTAKDVLATVMKLAKTIKKTAVVAGVTDGFIGNRMFLQYTRQATFLLEEGALPHQVDQALENFGFAMGIFRVHDLGGNDIDWAIRKRHYAENPDRIFSKLGDRLCELGRFGQKTGQGWYRYEPGQRDALPDPDVEQLIEAYREEIGIKPRSISDEEIVERCVFALTNEGAKILDEGFAQRASDVDVVYLTGYGFPMHRGGPMFYADTVGLANVVARMRQFAGIPSGDPAFWEPAALLARLAAEGKSFN